VSPAERFVRHNKVQTDRAISQAYARLASDSLAHAALTELLHCVRARSVRFLGAPVVNGHHPGVEALLNLSPFADRYVRSAASWPGSEASWRGAVSSLAQHLLGRYRMPAFLGAAWYATDDSYSDAKRLWFVAHGAGASFRSLEIPVRMTSKMEHIFLSSHDHFGIEFAMRRAELLGLGADDHLVDAVLATRLSADLTNSEFWRTVWIFLIVNSHAIALTHVGPIIDFLHSVRHERVAVETAEGTVMQEPPQPHFSMKGRTPRSVLRLMDEWHRGLGLATGGLSWDRSRLRPMVLEIPRREPSAPPLRWEFTELTSSEQLRAEGARLRHCVASYSHRCWRGASRIWSLRSRSDTKARPVLTIEIDPGRRAIVEARGFGNRRASGKALQLLQRWAARENLRITL
jgi:PcfJ-like protein